MIDAVLEHLTKDFFPDEPIFRWNIITPESCENLVRLPRQHAEIHKHGSWENLTNENQEEIMHWINLFHFDLNTFTCCILLSGHLASTSPMKPWCGSTRSLWSRDSALPLSIQRGKYLAFALGWSSKSKQKIHAIRSYIIIENDNNDMHTKWWFKTFDLHPYISSKRTNRIKSATAPHGWWRKFWICSTWCPAACLSGWMYFR